MDRNGQERLEGQLTKIFKRRSTKTVTDDETILAPWRFALEEFRRTLPDIITLPDMKVNKTAVKDLIKKQGIEIPGAHLEESWSLIMK
jgi:hypothetical protein